MKQYFRSIGSTLLTLVVVAIALVVLKHLWSYYMDEPWTRDAHIRADVVQVAPDVSGLVTEVHAGDRFGIMKFGSRMDVFVPLDARLTVAVGDMVRGGETVIAMLH